MKDQPNCKQVDYYYATSIGAKNLGYPDTGCYLITAPDKNRVVIPDIEPFQAKITAFYLAEILPYPYATYSHFGPNDIGNKEWITEQRHKIDTLNGKHTA